MKQFFSKIASFLLALLVLFSTFSFTVEKHYCGDSLMDVSFVGKADSCGAEMEAINVKKNCCKDEVHHIKGQDQLRQSQIDDFDFSKQQFLVALGVAYSNLFVEKESQKTHYKDLCPPNIHSDYQVLYQSFLI
ncbi:HYC_CC_PP family protein [Polaribacter staleyi]|uniref:HYC_CC_PP family protein n=1 Tax=Polaribacter staleyi TaxID=2022337 RepID=UPI0031BA6302